MAFLTAGAIFFFSVNSLFNLPTVSWFFPHSHGRGIIAKVMQKTYAYSRCSTERTPEKYMYSYQLLKSKVQDPDIKSMHPRVIEGTNVVVSVDIFVNTISQVNEINMDYQVDMYLRQGWEDPRLADDSRNFSMTLDFSYIDKIWIPDLFFQNEKDARTHQVTTPNFAFEIEANGYVTYTQRLSLTLDCPMNLLKFPLDYQECGMRIESFAYTSSDIQFKWNDKTEKPVELSEEITLPEYQITGIKYNSGNVSYPPNTAIFNYLTAKFYMQRNLNYYVVGTFIPGILTVILAWVSFWIDHKSAPARVSLSLLAVVTITTQFSGIRGQLPKVAYIKAIDIWMTGCLGFVFLALIEFAIVNRIQRREDKSEMVKSKAESKKYHIIEKQAPNSRDANQILLKEANGQSGFDEAKPIFEGEEPSSNGCCPCARCWCRKRGKSIKGENVDFISRFVFPILFLLFNVGWFWHYM